MTKIALLFPGQGSQKVGMGKDLYDTYPSVRAIFQKANDILGRDITKICFEGPSEELTKTENTQIGLFLVSASIYTILKENNIQPEVVLGHSLGELSAYYAAGVYSLETAIDVIKNRGEAMAASYPSEKSGMAAIMRISASEVIEILQPFKNDPVVAANFNSPEQTVISGEKESVMAAVKVFKEKGAKAIPLRVSGAFHSPLMKKGSDTFEAYLKSVDLNDAVIPVILNRTAQKEQDKNALRENLSMQIISSVRWVESIQSISDQVDMCIECGAGAVLTGLMKRILPEKQAISISNCESLSEFLNNK